MEPTTDYARLGDERIYDQVLGEGPIDLIINTGAWGSIDVEWDDPGIRLFHQKLARFSRVIQFDRRGSGASDPIPLDALLPWESFVEELECVMDEVGSARAALLGGALDRGPVSMLFAANQPERVSALIIFTTVARLLADDDYPFGVSEDEAEGYIRQIGEAWGPANCPRNGYRVERTTRRFWSGWQRWRDRDLRTGIHAGGIEVRGDDVGGIAVHLAARVMGEAEPGEILVSRTVRDLVVGSEIAFSDRGAHQLKGIEGEWQLYSVNRPGAAS